jgi:hypothetical protein
MSGLSQSQAYVGLAVAVLLGAWTLSSKKRSSRGNECSSDNSPSVIITDATSQSTLTSSELNVRTTLSTVRCIGQLHAAALLQENKGLYQREIFCLPSEHFTVIADTCYCFTRVAESLNLTVL